MFRFRRFRLLYRYGGKIVVAFDALPSLFATRIDASGGTPFGALPCAMPRLWRQYLLRAAKSAPDSGRIPTRLRSILHPTQAAAAPDSRYSRTRLPSISHPTGTAAATRLADRCHPTRNPSPPDNFSFPTRQGTKKEGFRNRNPLNNYLGNNTMIYFL